MPDCIGRKRRKKYGGGSRRIKKPTGSRHNRRITMAGDEDAEKCTDTKKETGHDARAPPLRE